MILAATQAAAVARAGARAHEQQLKPPSCVHGVCCPQLLVVAGAFVAAFFLIPREPCVSVKRMTTESAAYNSGTGDFEAYMLLHVQFGSQNYLDLGFEDLQVFLSDAETGAGLGTVDLPGITTLPPRSQTLVRFNVTMTQSTAPGFAPCAIKLGTGRNCLVEAMGVVTPRYSGSALGRVSFNTTAVLTGSSPAGIGGL